MKTYAIEYKRTSYIFVSVQADNEEEAWDAGLDELESMGFSMKNAEYEIESIETEEVT